ncbi:MAG: hypothetical protein WDO13_04570 [Verrucomicrobiota bacterium]
MAINFSDRILITNPTAFHLGRGIVVASALAFGFGIVTYFTGDILLPALAWCARGRCRRPSSAACSCGAA